MFQHRRGNFQAHNNSKETHTWHVLTTGEVQTRFWWRDLMGRSHLENTDADVRIILKWIFKKWDGEAWTRLLWLSTGTGGGHL
jgi:hypothetical protein